jgi:hypothetical protein
VEQNKGSNKLCQACLIARKKSLPALIDCNYSSYHRTKLGVYRVEFEAHMAKRAAEDEEQHALKAGQRPLASQDGNETLDFEDEFEDEFESEDEITEAGVDGRPDAEREREEEEAKGTFKN